MYIIQQGRKEALWICRAACAYAWTCTNESLQSPQSRPHPLSISQLIQLSPCLTTRWPSSSPPPLRSSNSQLLPAGDAQIVLATLTHTWPISQCPCTCFISLQSVSLIAGKQGQMHAWYSSTLSSFQVCFANTFTQKLGQQGFEGHFSVKWLHFA